jgi:hypothetical protein
LHRQIFYDFFCCNSVEFTSISLALVGGLSSNLIVMILVSLELCGGHIMWWTYKQEKMKLREYRPIMDARPLTMWFCVRLKIIYVSYLLIILLCMVVICVSPMVPYLPERCIRQFGLLQYIPAPVIAVIDSDWIDYDISVDWIVQPTSFFFLCYCTVSLKLNTVFCALFIALACVPLCNVYCVKV